jgi:hypothetical protein
MTYFDSVYKHTVVIHVMVVTHQDNRARSATTIDVLNSVKGISTLPLFCYQILGKYKYGPTILRWHVVPNQHLRNASERRGRRDVSGCRPTMPRTSALTHVACRLTSG